MKKFFLAIIAAMLVACGGGKKSSQDSSHGVGIDSATVAQTNAEDADYVPQRSDYSFRSDVRTITEDGEVRWDSIIVCLTDAKGHRQELYSQALPLDTLNWNKDSIGEISEDDWNFDGIPDLQVCTGPMNGFGNYTYDVWLWNDEAHKFEELKYDGVFSALLSTPTTSASSVSGGLMMMWKSYGINGRMANSLSRSVNKCQPVTYNSCELNDGTYLTPD